MMNETFWDRLKARIQAKNTTQEWVANTIGVPFGTFRKQMPKKAVEVAEKTVPVFNKDDPFEEKERKLTQACKLRDFAEFYIMQAIGFIYLEGEWLISYKVNDKGERESIPGSFTSETEYLNHLTAITDYSRRQLNEFINAYRVYIKNEALLNSINFDKAGSVRKILLLEKLVEKKEAGLMTLVELKKLLSEGSVVQIQQFLSTDHESLPGYTKILEANATVKVKGDTLFIDDQPVLKIVSENAESLKESLLSYFKAEKKKAELGDAFKENVDFYSKKINNFVSQEKIPVVIPVDSDVSDPKAFEKAAIKELDRFYKKWKLEH